MKNRRNYIIKITKFNLPSKTRAYSTETFPLQVTTLQVTTFMFKEYGKELILLPQSAKPDKSKVDIIIKSIKEKLIKPKIIYVYIPPQQWKKDGVDRLFKNSWYLLREHYKLPLEENTEDLVNFMTFLMLPFLKHGKSWNPVEYYGINPNNFPGLDIEYLNYSLNPLMGYMPTIESPSIPGFGKDMLVVPYTDKLLPFFFNQNTK